MPPMPFRSILRLREEAPPRTARSAPSRCPLFLTGGDQLPCELRVRAVGILREITHGERLRASVVSRAAARLDGATEGLAREAARRSLAEVRLEVISRVLELVPDVHRDPSELE